MSFFSGMIIGQYVPMDSMIHSLSAKTKIISVFIMIVGIFFSTEYYQFGLIFLFAWFVLLMSKLKFSFLMRGIRPLMIIFFLTFFLHMFMTDGEVIWRWYFFSITREGIIMGSKIFLRLFLLVIFTTIMTLTTSPIDMADGIESLLSPLKHLKLPVHEFSLMMTISLRFIPTLVEEIERIEAAQRARGADFTNGGIVKKVINFLPILVPLFILSFKRADELAMAMEARCYRGGDGRTKFHLDSFTSRDIISIFTVLGILAVVFF